METSTAVSSWENDPELAEVLARRRVQRLRKAGISERYEDAWSELGEQVYERAKSGRGTYLHGPCGTGKTHAAACAVRLALEAGDTARLRPTTALLDAVRSGYSDGRSESVLRDACSVGILALDDLGTERPTEWVIETLSRVLDERWARGLPTIVTSNYALGELRGTLGEVCGARIASRIAGMCDITHVGGPDRRLGNVNGNSR